jgi:hypothetical protein
MYVFPRFGTTVKRLNQYKEMYRIGFIIHNKHLFSNGLMQNAYFMYDVYRYLGNVCTFLSYDPDCKHVKGLESAAVKTISIHPSEFDTSAYDVLITIGIGISKPIYESCKRTNTYVIGFVCGNILAQTTEGCISSSEQSGFIGKEAPVDKIWMIEGYRHMKTFMELTRCVSVNLVRHTWSPKLLECFANQRKHTSLAYNLSSPKPKTKYNILILEPNLNYTKTCVIPFSICEYLNKQDAELINQVFLFNWNDTSKTAQHLAASFDVSKKTRFFKSMLIDEILHFFNSQIEPFIVISHQLNNPWNYLYYEMFHFGIPLVHNSPEFKQFGYYYSDTNIEEGAGAVLNAMQYHTKLYELQKPKIQTLLNSMDPNNSECQTYWKELLERDLFIATQRRLMGSA